VSDDCAAQPLRNPVQRGDGNQHHQDQKADLLPFQHADLLGQLKADAAGADDTDDRGGAGVGLEEIQQLTSEDRQHLRQHAEADAVQSATAY